VRTLQLEGITANGRPAREDIARSPETEATVSDYFELIDALAPRTPRPHLDQADLSGPRPVGGALSEHLATVLDRAAQYSMFVRIDMESSRHTDATLAIWQGLHREGRERSRRAAGDCSADRR